MSYILSGPLQSTIFTTLGNDAGLTRLVGSAIFDQAPSGVIAGDYVSLGEETVKDASDLACNGAVHDFVVTVVSQQPGFKTAKDIAGAVCNVLIDASPAMTRGHIVSLNFVSARAVRTKGDARRRIDLRFRARVDDS